MHSVASRGQVTSPKEIRDELDLQPGDELRFEATDAGVVLRKEVHENRFEKGRGVVDNLRHINEYTNDLK